MALADCLALETFSVLDGYNDTVIMTEIGKAINTRENHINATKTAWSPWLPVDAVAVDLVGEDDGTLQSGIRSWNTNIVKDLLSQYVVRMDAIQNEAHTDDRQWIDADDNTKELTVTTVAALVLSTFGSVIDFESVQGHFDIVRALKTLLADVSCIMGEDTWSAITLVDFKTVIIGIIDPDNYNVSSLGSVTFVVSTSSGSGGGLGTITTDHRVREYFRFDAGPTPDRDDGDFIWIRNNRSESQRISGPWTNDTWLKLDMNLEASVATNAVPDSFYTIEARMFKLTAAQHTAFLTTNASDPFAYESSATLLLTITSQGEEEDGVVSSRFVFIEDSTDLYLAWSVEYTTDNTDVEDWKDLIVDPGSPITNSTSGNFQRAKCLIFDTNGNDIS